MELNEVIISRAIIDRFHEKLCSNLETDVAIVGGGPSGLVAGYLLSKAGKNAVLFERKLAIGGGMWGGGMMFNEIVVQKAALHILDEFGVRYKEYQPNYFTADSIESISCLTARAVQAGLAVFNCISAEDVMMREDRVMGLVLNWSPVERTAMHVDPLAVKAEFIIDATGHPSEIVNCIQRKVPGKLMTPSGQIEGEKSMWAEKAEITTVENTREVFPGVYVSGMAANATFGAPRMGPIFGGMLLSGEKVAREILNRLP
jgi:thiamine thiazole synthase